MKKHYWYLLCAFVLCTIAYSGERESRITSPDGNLSIDVNLAAEGIPTYDVFFQNVPVIENNRLGVKRTDSDFSRGLRLLSRSSVETVHDDYTLLYGKKLHCQYHANKKIFHFLNSENQKLDIIFQISNDGIAFRYYFPDTSRAVKNIIKEETQFSFDDSTLAWIQPIDAAKTGWCGSNPSYEEYYYRGVNIKNLPKHEPGWVFPALFKAGKYWIAFSESAPDRNYCGCRLMHDSATTMFRIGFPQEGEVLPGGALNPESKTPWATPWRILVVGHNLGTLIESALGTDVAKPSVLTAAKFVKPGRSSWSWVLLKDDSTIYPVQKRFIDYAAEMGWEYCLIDAGWDTQIGYEKIGELCMYAASRKGGIFLWYNSAGSWNTTPLTPRNKLLTHELRMEEFSKIQKLGVKGIKVDFFGGDGQSMMSYYQDILQDAAQFGLMVNCHGASLPRGLERTYPNLVSMEAIKGFEYLTFDQSNTDQEASHCATIPFTRNLFDPMDFTPVCFSEIPGKQRRTTNSFELALSVIFLSGVQHYAEIPEGMAAVPGEVRQMMKDIPVAWDETKFIDGYPGEYVVLARRSGNDWYVAGINGEAAEKRLTFHLDFLQNAIGSVLITCGETPRTFQIVKNVVDVTQPLTLTLKPDDGFVLHLTAK
ncbi:MAG TPA: glycoside hydrolase family 97 catalytic domain-containing protein [Bacteroidota bacterium]|nr:glycoside hydrolase family 97 catalytic domain-containing protein [Bacteroidota bacterium]